MGVSSESRSRLQFVLWKGGVLRFAFCFAKAGNGGVLDKHEGELQIANGTNWLPHGWARLIGGDI